MHCYEHQKNVSAHYQIVIPYLVVILDLFGNYSTKKKNKKWHKMLQQNIQEAD